MTDIGLCAILCGGFIGSFYIWPKERRFAVLCIKDIENASEDGSHYVDRDEKSTIYRRLISFMGSTGVSLILLEYLLRKESGNNITVSRESLALKYLFYHEECLLKSLKVIMASGMATLTLFTGPLFDKGKVYQDWLNEDRIILLRDLVICPFGEEVFFRAVLLYLLKRRSIKTSIVISSLFFSFSHTHHIFSLAAGECRNAKECGESQSNPSKYWKKAAQKIAIIYSCTFACGLLDGYYYTTICKKNILAAVLSHSICNMIGAPQFNFIEESSQKGRIARVAFHIAGLIGWAFIVSKIK